MSIKQTLAQRWPQFLASLVAGVIGALAFPPFQIWWLMFFSLGIFLYLIKTKLRYREAFVLGFLYGLGYMAVLIWWMNAVDYRAYIALVLLQAFMFALVGTAIRIVLLSHAWPIIGAAVWVGSETLRGSQPFGGFPWGRLVHITSGTFLDSWVRLVGFAGVSALIFLLVAGIVQTISTPSRNRANLVVLGVIGFAIGGVFLPKGIAEPAGKVNIAIVQGNTPGDFGTWGRGEIFWLHVAATEGLIADIDDGKAAAPDFVIWPENSLDLDPKSAPWVGSQLTRLETELGAPILVGAILDGPTDTTALNAGIVWENGQERARYVKRNLVPYGEYVPFRQLLGDLVPRFRREIPRDLLPGDENGTIEIGETPIGDTICWDIAYDDAIWENIAADAQLLVTQTSNASFTGTSQPDQQWLITGLRAVETGRQVAVASTNGISGLFGASGDVVAQLPKEQPGVISAEVELATGITLAMRFGSHLMWLLSLIGAAATIWFYRKEYREQARDNSDV